MKNFQLVGRIASDLNKQTGGEKQTSYVRFSVAVGNQEKSDFFYITAFQQKADFICSHFKKGMWIQVTGDLKSESYTSKEGERKYQIKLIAKEVDFAGYNKTEVSGSYELAPDISTLEPPPIQTTTYMSN